MTLYNCLSQVIIIKAIIINKIAGDTVTNVTITLIVAVIVGYTLFDNE